MFLASAQPIHIPDGFLSLGVAAAAWVLTLFALVLAVRRSQEDFDERLIPMAGIMAAFIFAGQMINFPVAGGTSGHLIGATLAAIVLGPWMGIVVMTAVIALQALLFQDGGLVVMGANILVMGVIPALIGYGFFRAVARRTRTLKLVTTAVAAWLSVMAAALVTALFLGFSGTSSFRVVVPVMLGIHALIGIGEALITVAALSLIMRARPQALESSAEAGGRGWVVAGMVVALLVVFLAPFASGLPDGLEWVAQEKAFLDAAREAPFELLPDYTVPVLGETALSTVAAGLTGALVVALLAWGTAQLVRRRKGLEAGD
jgi:cobalt/nickel transport system permease protein